MTSIRRYAALAALLLVASACGTEKPAPEPSRSPAPTAETAVYRHYVALGDSYSAAPGVPPGKANICGRSEGNYPTLVASRLDAALEDRTCSAASIAHLSVAQGAGRAPQLTGVTATTDLVTLGIGANPALSTAWFWACGAVAAKDPGGSPCRDAMQTSTGDQLLAAIETEGAQLSAAVDQVRRRAPGARVVLVGYPQVFPAKGSCPDRLPFAAGDLRYADQTVRALNAMISDVASAQDADYLDVYAASKGHDICAADPWIQGTDTVTGEALRYHPRAIEQRAVADLLVDLLR